MSAFVKFPSISNLHNLYRNLRLKHGDGPLPTVKYRAKIKLHGTNAGVRIDPDGTVTAQKRSSDIGEQDNAGFAAWVNDNKEAFAQRARHCTMILFGEWAGPGVQKGVAVTDIPEKTFFVFAAQMEDIIVIEPRFLEILTGLDYIGDPPLPITHLKVLPWETDVIELDFDSPETITEKLDYLNNLVASVENEDPYISKTFGIKGVGEGVVMTPLTSLSPQHYSKFMFKVKGEKHKTTTTKNPAQLNPEKFAAISVFAEQVVTPARLQQWYETDMPETPQITDIGQFLKAISIDVNRECQAEIEASGFEWKELNRAVTSRAAEWYKTQVNEIS